MENNNISQVAVPPDFIFKKKEDQTGRTVPAKGVVGADIMYDLERMEYPPEGGMFAWFRDCPYPAKGFPFPQAIYALNLVKKILRESITVLATMDKVTQVLFGISFVLLPKKKKMKLIANGMDAYSMMAQDALGSFMISEDKYSRLSSELRRFIEGFFIRIGVRETSVKNFAEVVASFIQYDNAYYFRLEDIFSETTKQKLMENPIGEIRRMLLILSKRERKGNEGKFIQAVKVFEWILKMPQYRQAFIDTVNDCDFEKLQWEPLDEKGMSPDIYHTLLWNDYDFRGESIEIRQQKYIDFHTKYPPFPLRMTVKLV